MNNSVPTTARVDVKSAWASKINWAQALSVAATVLTVFGIDVPPDLQVKIIAGISGATAVATWIMRTFFTAAVTPSSLPPSSLPSQ